MCELLGMECNVPTDIVFSFSGLALRGGARGPHADGWGLALYDRVFPSGYPLDRAKLYRAVARIGKELGESGTFNFLLGDGEQMFARCATKLSYIVRRAPFEKATLADDDLTVDFSEVTTPRDRVAIVATAPLTRDETWTSGRPGEMWVFRRGQLAATLRS